MIKIVIILAAVLVGVVGTIVSWEQHLNETIKPATGSQAAANTPAPSRAAPTTPVSDKNVVFGFEVTDLSGAGSVRTLTTELTNSGTDDAHNVKAKVEITSGTTKIKQDGQDFLTVDIGILKAGEKTIKEVTLKFSTADGMKIMQNGAKITLTLTSDEKTQTFNYDYKP